MKRRDASTQLGKVAWRIGEAPEEFFLVLVDFPDAHFTSEHGSVVLARSKGHGLQG